MCLIHNNTPNILLFPIPCWEYSLYKIGVSLNSPPVHQSTVMVDAVSVPPYIFSLKLKDPTWSASLRGVLGPVDISICDFHKKNNVFFKYVHYLALLFINSKSLYDDWNFNGKCLLLSVLFHIPILTFLL